MHPIEKFHKMVTAGNVLGPEGTWISQNDALKRKKTLLGRLFSGEVERNGKWTSIKIPRAKVQATSANTPISKDNDVIHLNSAAITETKPDLREAIATKPVKKQDAPPFIRQTQQETALPAPTVVTQKSSSVATEKPAELQTPSPVPPPPPETKPFATDDLQEQEAPPEHQSKSGVFERETITIRTIHLGKETTLTVSETRAGSALVAVCSVQGFIDQSNADDFNSQLLSMLEFGVRYFVIDLEHTTLVGSAGWGVFAVTARFVKASHGHLIICGMKEEIEESFRLLQFNEVIDSQKTISDCLEVIQTIIDTRDSEPAAVDEERAIFHNYGESYEDLPLPEKIKTIIAMNGPLSLFKIAAQLKTEQFGSQSISIFKVYMHLKEMNLDTKLKQTRYYRSC
jgi:anti-anti-sigma factor